MVYNGTSFCEDLSFLITHRGREAGVECCVEYLDFHRPPKMPTEFDIYLLHKTDTTFPSIVELRKNNPKAKIIVFSGNTYLPPEIERIVDESIYSPCLFKKLDSLIGFG